MTASDWTVERLVEGVRAGETRALARAITLVEDRDPIAQDLVRELYSGTGRAHAVGITGPPGVGKSSLVAALVARLRAHEQTVGVVSVDPTSPFTRGALLGDRIRLADHFLDPGVFIRSMGTRGHVGGLAEAALQAVLLLDAAGKDVIFLETVGTGQSDVGVASIADTVVLVLMPGSGDSVQALKAGIMEIPDVIAVNKADHPLARAAEKDVRQVLALAPDGPQPPIVLTDALSGDGIDELWARIEEHHAALGADGALAARRRENLQAEVITVATARARRRLESAVAGDPRLRELLERVGRRELDPLTAAHEILRQTFPDGDEDRTDTR
jgi:LAO/AO transport system kinase